MELILNIFGIIAVLVITAAALLIMMRQRSGPELVKPADGQRLEIVQRVEYFLPWRPFHQKRLPEGASHALYGQEENLALRGVMEVIEDTLSKEVDGLSGVGTRSLERAAGMIEAYLDLHRRLSRMVSQAPLGK